MKSLYKVLLVLIALGAGATYYVKSRNVDLRSLFSSNCDCHGSSCDVKPKHDHVVPAVAALPVEVIEEVVVPVQEDK